MALSRCKHTLSPPPPTRPPLSWRMVSLATTEERTPEERSEIALMMQSSKAQRVQSFEVFMFSPALAMNNIPWMHQALQREA